MVYVSSNITGLTTQQDKFNSASATAPTIDASGDCGTHKCQQEPEACRGGLWLESCGRLQSYLFKASMHKHGQMQVCAMPQGATAASGEYL
jgi:hypothetical protein